MRLFRTSLKSCTCVNTEYDIWLTCCEIWEWSNHTLITFNINRFSILLFNFGVVLIDVAPNLICFIPSPLSKSLMYFDWFMKMSSFICLIWSIRKNINLPIFLISNSYYIKLAKSSSKNLLVISKIISSIYLH